MSDSIKQTTEDTLAAEASRRVFLVPHDRYTAMTTGRATALLVPAESGVSIADELDIVDARTGGTLRVNVTYAEPAYEDQLLLSLLPYAAQQDKVHPDEVEFLQLVSTAYAHAALPAFINDPATGLPGQVVIPTEIIMGNMPEGTPFPAGTRLPIGFKVMFVNLGLRVLVDAMIDFSTVDVKERTVDHEVPVEPLLAQLKA